ncbi:unnamed protein product [Spirodela intermedia]|uniref:Uncharacterized protein n=1 Tax=Spirodela intermedia TaxID=51605 RepID=A0A7I8ITA0_SPIIN|nr:unnamed protein product [Spirodela intermedia]CAA6661104.1 unnamed protein product [Spirodela intermedia]
MSNHVNGDMAVGEEELPAASEAERQIGASMMEQLLFGLPSLCRLSMTNSSMRRAANDDNAWKALYHKDFTWSRMASLRSTDWKAYYAATKAVVDVNAEYAAVVDSWAVALKLGPGGGGGGGQGGVAFEVRDVRAGWCMVHHHSSVMLADPDAGHNNIFG